MQKRIAQHYDAAGVEKKWQQEWLRSNLYSAVDFDTRPKQYVLVEFPFLSGDGLHVGHCLSYIAQDVIARWRRMQGHNVLYPIGWDAFGLPTENYAIKTKTKPQVVTANNIANFKRQIQSLGISFDWSRELSTADASYYKWTQWIFLQLFKKGLAEKKEMPINWCPSCKIGLAFEEVIDGKCERCGTLVERRNIKQWILKITKYADRLIDDLDTVNFLPEIKQSQINWIGRSEGAEITFPVTSVGVQANAKNHIKIFTTRPDTLFGATYLVLAPEHSYIANHESFITNYKDIEKYVRQAAQKTERERQESREKTGIELKGIKAINPANGEEIPIWIADFVLAGYGTGAVFADAHDERDFEMAKKYNIPIRVSLRPNDDELWHKVEQLEVCYTQEGVLVNSAQFSGLSSEEARPKIIEWLGLKGAATQKVTYKLRDWIFSRQHYWGEPIPIIHCEKCGTVPLPEKDLPLTLPDVEYYEPTDTGESPLAKITDWVNVKCPTCGGAAKRETDTMPNWAGSSWYFLRYTDPANEKRLADPKKLKYWLPVDLYNGGSEHTTLHLLYSRFWHKFLYDIGEVPTPEPYQRRVQHGIILAPDGQKMSKSKGNVINPDDIVARYGADVLRLYILFMGEYDQVKAWSDANIAGVARFLSRLWRFMSSADISEEVSAAESSTLHTTIKAVASDLERRSFNTAVSHLMVLLNELEKQSTAGRATLEAVVRLMAPFAPHLAEECWQVVLKNKGSVHTEVWPAYDESHIASEGVRVGVQVNGKVRADLLVTSAMTENDIRSQALALPQVQKYIEGKMIKKFIYVKNKIVSVVV